jgi:hypothetical protein
MALNSRVNRYRMALFVFSAGTLALAAGEIFHYLRVDSFGGLVVSAFRLVILCFFLWVMHRSRTDSSIDKSSVIDMGIIGLLAIYVFSLLGTPVTR